MKILIAFLAVITQGVQAGTPPAPMSGSYVIGPAPADFLDLQDAVAALETAGMDADIKFMLKPGSHEVHVVLDQLLRTGDPEARLSIASLEPDDPAHLHFAAPHAGQNWLLKLDGVSGIDIGNLIWQSTGTGDFTRILMLTGGTSDVNIVDNELISHPVSAAAGVSENYTISVESTSGFSDIQITGNRFESGGGALAMSAVSQFMANGVVIKDNEVLDYSEGMQFAGMKLSYLEGLQLRGNRVSNLAGGVGLSLDHINTMQMEGNHIEILDGENGLALIMRFMDQDGIGQSWLRNNALISVNTGVLIGSFSQNLHLWHNTVLVLDQGGGFGGKYALQIEHSLVANTVLKGNMLINDSMNALARVVQLVSLSNVSDSSNNVLHSGTVALYEVNSIVYTDLPNVQILTGLETGSIISTVPFVDGDNGVVHLLNSAFSNAQFKRAPDVNVLFDLDGQLRPASRVMMGADDLPASEVIFDHGFNF